MKTKIMAAAAALALVLTTASAFAGGAYTSSYCPNMSAGGGTYTTFDVKRCP
jgi:hypothetical protein